MLPNNLVRTKKLCAVYIKSSLNLSAFSSPVQYVKFTTPINTEPKEITLLVNGENSEIIDLSHAHMKNVCNRFSDSTNFSVSFDSVLNFTPVSNNWDDDKMILKPLVVKEKVTEIAEFNSDLLGDFFSDDFDIEPIIEVEEVSESPAELLSYITEHLAVIPESESEEVPEVVNEQVLEVKEETPTSIPTTLDSLDLPVFIAQNDEEGKLIKKPANITSSDLLSVLDAWLSSTGQKNQFLEALREAKKLGHNSLVVYPYPAIEFFIDSSGQLKKKLVRSENISQITNRPGTVIQRTGRASSPLYSNLFYISPIRVKDSKGNIYLAQTYLKKVQGEITYSWQQQSHNIAWFDGGNLHYYNSKQPELIAEHQLYSVIEADGVDIFPDLSIAQISLEHLSPSINGLYETTKDNRTFDKLNQKPSSNEEAYRTSEKVLVKPRIFEGFAHPNLKPKKPQKATITERKIPKPLRLDGARTNDHEYQLRAIIGNVPMILTFKKSDHLWDVIALPIKVPYYHLAVYLSDKLGSTELLSYVAKYQQDLSYNLAKVEVQIEEVKEQVTNLPDSEHYLPRSRSLQTKIDSLSKVSEDIKEIIESLENLILNIKQNRKPDRLDILESTKIIRELLNSEHIKPESSYTDNYYRWHNIGSLRIVEQIEKEKPTYTLTIVGDEKDTRRSSIPLVMRWLRGVPKILQDYFGGTYPTNQEIKDRLMNVYPFYKRKKKEGDKIDKSFINLEADMVIHTKGKLKIEIYFKGELQTTQVLSITKPVNSQERQGKIPVKIASSIEIKSLEVLTHLLRCGEYKQTFDAQNHLNKLVQKFVNSNIQLFTKEKEEKIVSKVAIRDLLGFSKESKGLPQIAKRYNQFITPFTSESDVNLGKLVNLLTLETFDKHDAQNLFDAMVNNWKKWKKGEYINIAGFNLCTSNPGDLIGHIFHKVKGNQSRSQVIWGNFIDELYQLSKIRVGFRTSEGVMLTPWSLLPTDRKTWEYRIKIQLIDILSVGQRERLERVEELLKNEKTREEGQKLRDNIRGGSVEAWLRMDIDKLYIQLHEARPTWESLVHSNVLSHLSALHDALNVTERV
jgi:hypothetical protein